MAVVTVRINGHDYQVACDDGQEEHLRLLADDLNDRIASLTFNMRNKPNESMALLLSALMMTDELLESKKEFSQANGLAAQEKHAAQESRMIEMETAMASTLEEIAQRIEKIADQIEVS